MAKDYISLVEMELSFKTEDVIKELLIRIGKIDLFQSMCLLENHEISELESDTKKISDPKKAKKYMSTLNRQIKLRKTLIARYEATIGKYMDESKTMANDLCREILAVANKPKSFFLDILNKMDKTLGNTFQKEGLKKVKAVVEEHFPDQEVIVQKSSENIKGKGKE